MERAILDCLEKNPIIAAVGDDKWSKALASPVPVIFYMSANLGTLAHRIAEAHEKNKFLLVHLDLARGIGKDKEGICFLAAMGIDGILSTKPALIRAAKEEGLFTVQRFFAVDSGGTANIAELSSSARADLMEIMPGVVDKVIRLYAEKGFLVIAGGLIETKKEVMAAVGSGATAVSTGTEELWYI